jgi:hypothetical protein
MTLQAHFSIYHHCTAAPIVTARSREGFSWVDIAAADSGGLLLTIHCAGPEQAERAAEKLREVFAIARGKESTTDELQARMKDGRKAEAEFARQQKAALIACFGPEAKQPPSDYWDEVPSEQIKP